MPCLRLKLNHALFFLRRILTARAEIGKARLKFCESDSLCTIGLVSTDAKIVR